MAGYVRFINSSKTISGLITATLLWTIPATSLAAEEEVIAGGEIEFQWHCASCHGEGAKGNGTMAKYLGLKPRDLARLNKKNGNRFPFWRVYRTIDGRGEVKGHETREMPIWGARFPMKAEGGSTAAQALVVGRILGLVFYLQYIQES